MPHPSSPPSLAPAAQGPARDRAPIALLLALLATVTYAVFAHGATDTPAETRVQLALAILTLLVAGALASGRPGIRADTPVPARAGLAALLAFAVWSGLTLLWSIAPDDTWTQINRAVAYALVAILGVVVGASVPRACERVALGWLAVAVATALYAVGGKTFPGINVPGVFDLNQTATLARLRAPLDYWNALGLVLVMGVPVALRLALDRTRTERVRVAGALAVYLLTVTLGMTYSRGGVLALVVVLAVLVAGGGAGRLKTVLLAAVVGAAVAIPLTVAFSREALTQSGTSLAQRSSDGRLLTLAMLAGAVALAAAAAALIRHEDRVRWRPQDTRTVARLAVIGVSAAAVVGVLAVTASTRGLPGTVHALQRSFTRPTQDKLLDPSRLATTTSGNRWVWWREAAGAFSDRPVGGWGAGSFRVTHLRYRKNTIAVVQPHSVPLQFLAETGIVGLLLVYGGIGALLWAAVARVRALAAGRDRDMALALLAAVAAFLVHGLYDWDWDIPGVTLPPLLFLGVLAASRRTDRRPSVPRKIVLFTDPERDARTRPAALAGVAAVTVALFAYATSAVLPAWSASKTSSAEEAIGGAQASDDALQRAAAQADLAARLDPLSVEPLLLSATIAERRGRRLEARADLLQAVDRQPENARSWSQLGALALTLADRPGLVQATARALALDPHNPLLRALASRAASFLTPPGDSATATGTPLPAAPAAPAAPAPVPATPAPATPPTPAPATPAPATPAPDGSGGAAARAAP